MFYDHWEQLKRVFCLCFSRSLFNHHTTLSECTAATYRPTPLSLSFHIHPVSGSEIDVRHQPLRGCRSGWVAVSSSFLGKGPWEIFSEFLACFITNCLCPFYLKVNVFLDIKILDTQFLSLSSLNTLLKSLMIISFSFSYKSLFA